MFCIGIVVGFVFIIRFFKVGVIYVVFIYFIVFVVGYFIYDFLYRYRFVLSSLRILYVCWC